MSDTSSNSGGKMQQRLRDMKSKLRKQMNEAENKMKDYNTEEGVPVKTIDVDMDTRNDQVFSHKESNKANPI